MDTNTTAPDVSTSGAVLTADAGSKAVHVCDGTTEEPTAARRKDAIVDMLLELSDIDFPIAISWAYAIQRRWADFAEV